MSGECLNSCLQGLRVSSSCQVFAKALYSGWKPKGLGQGLGVNGIKGGKPIFQMAQNTLLIYLLNTPPVGSRPCNLRKKIYKNL